MLDEIECYLLSKMKRERAETEMAVVKHLMEIGDDEEQAEVPAEQTTDEAIQELHNALAVK